ncbi:CMRF35-like molecule 9 isoform X1 [Podarcis raffonei]|uniref:CMRF35-like molecule 9 isoform X1 n=1 Tax=Podarcis raffonei TaxID=65483 RepID=UPI0023296603|nr:CMRF35-like molecule 9 isoform X1 [Podarcis raffonei]
MRPLRMLSLLGWVLISGKEEKNATSRPQILNHKEEVCQNAWDVTTESPEIEDSRDKWWKAKETWQLTGPVEVHGFEGKSLSLCCHYQQTYKDNTKIWCKIKEGLLSDSCKTLISSDEKVNMGRVSLRENKKEHYFQVTMDSLNLDDSGVYYCVIYRPYLFNIRHKVNVAVSPDPEEKLSTTETPEFITSVVKSTHSPDPTETPADSKLYILIYSIIPLFILVLLATVVLLVMSRKTKTESHFQRKEELNLPERMPTHNTEDTQNENTISDQPPDHNETGLYRIVKVLPENDYEEIHSQEKTSEEQDEVSYASLDISDHHGHVYNNINFSRPAHPETPAQEVFYTEVKPDH